MSVYAELAVTTNFSFLRGASHPQELVARADELGLTAIGIADRNSFAGVVRAYDEARKRNIKLLVGTRLVTIDGFEVLTYPTDRAAAAPWAQRNMPVRFPLSPRCARRRSSRPHLPCRRALPSRRRDAPARPFGRTRRSISRTARRRQ